MSFKTEVKSNALGRARAKKLWKEWESVEISRENYAKHYNGFNLACSVKGSGLYNIENERPRKNVKYGSDFSNWNYPGNNAVNGLIDIGIKYSGLVCLAMQ